MVVRFFVNGGNRSRPRDVINLHMGKEMLPVKNPSSVRLIQVMAALIVLCAACAASSQQTIYTFPSDWLSGANPMGGLIRDAAGNLYGTTRDGGASFKGTVFELSLQPDGVWKETVLYSFKGYNYKDGSAPTAPLVFDKAGNLYGTTGNGGTADRGTAFQLSPDGHGGWSETVLHSFYGMIGTHPQAGLILDAAGSLYGTTIGGGNSSCTINNGSGCGTVFRLKKNRYGKWNVSVLHSFSGQPDGAGPLAGLVLDSAGNLYGSTGQGGGSNAGTVFKLARAGTTWTYSVIYSFAGGPNGTGGGALVLDNAGNLYGPGGGGDQRYDGIVFRLTLHNGSWTEGVLHTFGAAGDGIHPIAVTLDSAGNLYGTTLSDGVSSDGIVYKLTPNPNGPWTETTLYTFPLNSNGPYPDAPLIWNAAQTSLFSTAVASGSSAGTVYEVTP